MPKGKLKLLYIVLDGLSDGPYRLKELGNKTPLEAAYKPNMDSLAREGRTGIMHPIAPGIAPESDVAVISILGYDPYRYYTGRGPLESFAAGLEVNPGDLAIRANFATKGQGREIIDRRAGRSLSAEEAEQLCKEVSSQLKLESIPDSTFQLKHTIGHRACLVIRTKKGSLSGEITNTDPAYKRDGPVSIPQEGGFENIYQYVGPLEDCKDLKGATIAALLTNEFVLKSCEILDKSPVNQKRREKGLPQANLILLRDAGNRLPKFPDMKSKFGLRMACLADMPVEKGIASLTGMETIELPPPSSDLQRDYTLRAEKTLEAIRDFEGLYIHIKGPDIPGHDGDSQAKKVAIEAIDRNFLGPVLEGIAPKETVIVLTADHTTPCQLKSHSHDPVPVVLYGGNIKPDTVLDFSEESCQKGSLGEFKGTQLMPLVVKYLKA
ncbi:MAG TPA: alkaline phosphatase family protein [Candidatus Hypogeohydataceae bacterium YC40]